VNKPKLLDLFCGAGGAGMGYHRAGFDVTGVDMNPQPKYPFKFIQADALNYVAQYGWMFDAIHASPPCQTHSSITKTAKTQGDHLDLIPVTRFWLQSLGLPYVIENVPGARKYLRNPIELCGTSFGLYLVRHRYFESNISLVATHKCRHLMKVAKHGRPAKRFEEYAAVTGHFSDVEYGQIAMGIKWMGQKELAQAIPPAYTEYIGKQLMMAVIHRQESEAA